MALIHFWLNLFSISGTLAVIFGYEFFSAKDPNGGEGIVFLIFGGVAFFLGFQVLKAFTDPLAAGLDYWLMPAHHAPATDRQKRTLVIVYAFTILLPMSAVILFYLGLKHGFPIERMAVPLIYGLLTFLLLSFLLHAARAIYMFVKAPTPSNSDHSRVE